MNQINQGETSPNGKDNLTISMSPSKHNLAS